MLAPLTIGMMHNPHGEFIFRVTGARTCSSCHSVKIQNEVTQFTLLDNAKVKHLIREGEGAHRSGHFSHCLNCHVGGQLDLEEEDHD